MTNKYIHNLVKSIGRMSWKQMKRKYFNTTQIFVIQKTVSENKTW